MKTAKELFGERFGRLPQWAQRYVSKLEGDLQISQEQSLRLAGGAGALVQVRAFHDGSIETVGFAPDFAAVRFILGKHSEAWIEAQRQKDGTLKLCAGRGLSVQPEAWNTVSVRAET